MHSIGGSVNLVVLRVPTVSAAVLRCVSGALLNTATETVGERARTAGFSALLDHARAVELARTGGAAIHRPHRPLDRRTPLVHDAATGRETITDDRIRRELHQGPARQV